MILTLLFYWAVHPGAMTIHNDTKYSDTKHKESI
jgi:hypothetical protein